MSGYKFNKNDLGKICLLFLVKSFSSKYTEFRKNDKMHLIFSSIIILFTEKVKRQETKKILQRSAAILLIVVLRSLIKWCESKTILCFSNFSFSTLLIFFPSLLLSRPLVSLLSLFYWHISYLPSSTTFQGCGLGWCP